MRFIALPAARIYVDIAKDLNLARQAYIGGFLEVIAQPDFFHKRERVGIA